MINMKIIFPDELLLVTLVTLLLFLLRRARLAKNKMQAQNFPGCSQATNILYFMIRDIWGQKDLNIRESFVSFRAEKVSIGAEKVRIGAGKTAYQS